MFRNFILATAVIAVIFACGSDIPEEKNPVAVGDQTGIGSNSSRATDNLRESSVGEGDLYGQAKASLSYLQAELNNASGIVPGVGTVAVFIDDNLNLIMRNNAEGGIVETKVNLKSLNPDPKSLEIYPEGDKGSYPGFRMFTQNGKSVVEITKGGKTTRQDYLEIFLAERSSVERVISGLVQAVRSAQGAGIPQ